MFAALRNTGELPCASGTEVTVACFPGLRLVFLRDWCITAKLIADRDAFRRSDSDAFFIRVLVLPNSVKMEAQGRMEQFPAIRAFVRWRIANGLNLAPRWIRGGRIGKNPFFQDIYLKSFSRSAK